MKDVVEADQFTPVRPFAEALAEVPNTLPNDFLSSFESILARRRFTF
jgi:hypothetical protein